MKHIIIDTNIVIDYPEILSNKLDNVRLVVPSEVIQQLLNYKSNIRQILISIIQNAQQAGNIEIVDTSSHTSPTNYVSKIGFVDASLVSYAKFLESEKNGAVIIATKDKQLIAFAKENNVNAIGPDELFKLFQNDVTVNSEIKQATLKLNKLERTKWLLNIGVSILNTAAILILIGHVVPITKKLTVPFIIISLILFGFLLYTIRERFRIGYAISEIGVGIAAIIWTFSPDFDIDKLLITPEIILRIAAALYIIVRGLDNLSKGLEGKSYETTFKRLLLINK